MKTVLIVDDEVGIAEVLADLLTDEGYHVVTAANGKHALRRLAEVKPDLMLVDFMMPAPNGAGLLRTMATDPATRDIPVVMMSSLDEAAVAERCTGYDVFLRKPFKISDVLDAVAGLIGGASLG